MALNFDENQPKYKCCCGCMKLRTGAIVIAAMMILGIGISIWAYLDVADDTETHDSNSTLDEFGSLESKHAGKPVNSTEKKVRNGIGSSTATVSLSSLIPHVVTAIVAVVWLIIAIHRESSKCVLPALIFLAIRIILDLLNLAWTIAIVVIGSMSWAPTMVTSAGSNGTEITWESFQYRGFVFHHFIKQFTTAVCILIAAAVRFWFLMVLRAFRRYLQDKEAFRAGCMTGQEIMAPQQAQTWGFQTAGERI